MPSPLSLYFSMTILITRCVLRRIQVEGRASVKDMIFLLGEYGCRDQ